MRVNCIWDGINEIKVVHVDVVNSKKIKALIALVDRLFLKASWENGPE